MAYEIGFFALPAKNMEAMKKFYQQVMGWSFEARDKDFEYIMANDEMIGSLETALSLFSPSSRCAKMYFRAESMSIALAKVETNKGKISVPSTAINTNHNTLYL